ncbi:hypothetical protein [Roseinatronobacter alkalisoli]|uniref:Uncharacterized protein n=1 Tax=Roseinatronobacter alkalisoli TaxID=3028235 RepID=A0ABT5T6C8_9RHOB|nr:hypothetical protein [Roseinatronobacter sp. HJB301]MDD7970599.1 hypothetical protein [Roseinatronobacter sp. HJB301]
MMELARADAASGRIEALTDGMTALADHVAASITHGSGEQRMTTDVSDKLESAFPEIAPAVRVAEKAVDSVRTLRSKAIAFSDHVTQLREAQKKEKEGPAKERRLVTQLRQSLKAMLACLARWLTHPGMPESLAAEGADILCDADRILQQPEDSSPEL